MAASAFFQQLYSTLTGNGSTAAIAQLSGVLEVDVFVEDSPTWGGGTLKLQTSPDAGTTWIDVPSASWTSGGGRLTSSGPIVVANSSQIRLTLTGATGPSITPNVAVRRLEFRPVDTDAVMTANGTSKTFRAPALPDNVGVYIYGTFGSGTVKFQVSPDNGTTWYTVHSKTANDYTRVTNVREGLFRFVLSGATSPSLTYQLV